MTTYSGQGIEIPMSASGDADTWQYHFVKHAGTAKRFDLSTGGSGPGPIGVLQNDPRTGESGNVRVAGTTLVYADASTGITYGDFVTSGSDGQAIIASGSTVTGKAMQTIATGASILIEVLLLPFQSAVVDNTP